MMSTFLAIFCTGLLAIQAPETQTADQKLTERYRLAAEAQRKAAIANAGVELKKLVALSRKHRAKKNRGGVATIARQISELKARQARLKRNVPPFRATMHPLKLEVGDIGYLDAPKLASWYLVVGSVVDANTLVVTCEYRTRIVTGSTRGGFPVVTSRMSSVKLGPTYWVTDLSTIGIATDSRFKPEGPFVVTGTKSYTTVLGTTKTVLVLTRVPLKPSALPATKKR